MTTSLLFVYIFLDLVKRAVLTSVGELWRYKNDRCYYYCMLRGLRSLEMIRHGRSYTRFGQSHSVEFSLTRGQHAEIQRGRAEAVFFLFCFLADLYQQSEEGLYLGFNSGSDCVVLCYAALM